MNKSKRRYTVKLMGLLEYWRYFGEHFEEPWGLTDSGYPARFAMGYCDHGEREVVVCTVLDWECRLWHELGHMVGLEHVRERGNVMHPWGVFRGVRGIDEVKRRLGSDLERYERVIESECKN